MPNVNLSPYSTQQNELDRRRKLAQALMQESVTPLEMPQQPGVQISPYAGLAKILSGIVGNYKGAKLDKEQRALDTSKQEAVRSQLAQLLSSQGGTTQYAGPVQFPTQRDVALPPDSYVEAQAFSSEFPQVQNLAAALRGQREKRVDTQQAQGFDAEQAALQRQFLSGQKEKEMAQAMMLANRPKAVGSYAPGGVFGVEDPATATFTQQGSVPNRPLATPQPQPPMTPERFQQEQQLKTPPRPVGVQTLDANGKPVTQFVNPQAGQTFAGQPTAEQQNRASALGKIDPVLSSISELSEKINTGKGIEAKAQGEAAKAAARLNYNDDVAEYEAIISGFTPMVARAVGHTGVLTQQDVDSVRKLFPEPGDSKTLRDRKIARVKMILSDNAPPKADDKKRTRIKF